MLAVWLSEPANDKFLSKIGVDTNAIEITDVASLGNLVLVLRVRHGNKAANDKTFARAIEIRWQLVSRDRLQFYYITSGCRQKISAGVKQAKNSIDNYQSFCVMVRMFTISGKSLCRKSSARRVVKTGRGDRAP